MAWAEDRAQARAALRCAALLSAALALGPSGCAGDKDSGGEPAPPALPARAWRPIDPAESPFAAEAPSDAYCSELAWTLYEGDFEVRSDLCLWGVYAQALTEDIGAGEVLALTFTWGETWAAEPTTAELALSLGDEALWSQRVPVPGPAGQAALRLPLTEAHPAGAQASLRIANHGFNTYGWSDAFIEQPEPTP